MKQCWLYRFVTSDKALLEPKALCLCDPACHVQLDEMRRARRPEEEMQSPEMELSLRLGAKEAALRERDSHVDEVSLAHSRW